MESMAQSRIHLHKTRVSRGLRNRRLCNPKLRNRSDSEAYADLSLQYRIFRRRFAQGSGTRQICRLCNVLGSRHITLRRRKKRASETILEPRSYKPSASEVIEADLSLQQGISLPSGCAEFVCSQYEPRRFPTEVAILCAVIQICAVRLLRSVSVGLDWVVTGASDPIYGAESAPHPV